MIVICSVLKFECETLMKLVFVMTEAFLELSQHRWWRDFLSSGLFRNVSNIYDGAYIPVCILVYLSFFINVCQIHLLDHYVYFSKTYSFCLFFHCWNIFRVTFGDTGEFVICGKQHRSNTFILTNLPFWPCQI